MDNNNGDLLHKLLTLQCNNDFDDSGTSTFDPGPANSKIPFISCRFSNSKKLKRVGEGFPCVPAEPAPDLIRGFRRSRACGGWPGSGAASQMRHSNLWRRQPRSAVPPPRVAARECGGHSSPRVSRYLICRTFSTQSESLTGQYCFAPGCSSRGFQCNWRNLLAFAKLSSYIFIV